MAFLSIWLIGVFEIHDLLSVLSEIMVWVQSPTGNPWSAIRVECDDGFGLVWSLTSRQQQQQQTTTTTMRTTKTRTTTMTMTMAMAMVMTTTTTTTWRSEPTERVLFHFLQHESSHSREWTNTGSTLFFPNKIQHFIFYLSQLFLCGTFLR